MLPTNYSKSLLHSLHQKFEGLPYGNITIERIKDFVRWHTFHNLSAKGFRLSDLPPLKLKVIQNKDLSVTITGSDFFTSLLLVGYYLPPRHFDVEAVYDGPMMHKYYWMYDSYLQVTSTSHPMIPLSGERWALIDPSHVLEFISVPLKSSYEKKLLNLLED